MAIFGIRSIIITLNFILLIHSKYSYGVVDNINIVRITDFDYEVQTIDGIDGKIYSIRVDSNGNIYFRDYANVVYVLKNGTTEPVPIESSGVSFDIALDKEDNIYIANNGGVYQLVETAQNELLEGPARSIYADKDYLYWGLLSGGIYRVNNCLLSQLRKYYYKSRTSNHFTHSFEMLKGILKDSAEKIDGVSNLVKKLAVSSKGHVFYVDDDEKDVFVLEHDNPSPRKIYLGDRLVYDVKIDPDDNVFFAGILGLYVYRSDDSFSWSATKINFTVGTLYTVYPHGNDIYLGGDGVAYKLERKSTT